MKSKLKFVVVILSLMLVSTLQAQQVISSAGTTFTGTGVQLSWTIGEPVIETFTAGSTTLTQGFHQSKLTVTAIEPLSLTGIDLSVYPNPVSAELKLSVSGNLNGNLDYRLFDMTGKMIITKKIDHQPELINMMNYQSGTYLLKVFRNENESLQTFKIVKN